jgi:hypothetical protein
MTPEERALLVVIAAWCASDMNGSPAAEKLRDDVFNLIRRVDNARS